MRSVAKYTIDDNPTEVGNSIFQEQKSFPHLYELNSAPKEDTHHVKMDTTILASKHSSLWRKVLKRFITPFRIRKTPSQSSSLGIAMVQETISNHTPKKKLKKKGEVPEKLVAERTEKLNNFEQKKGFLEHQLTLVTLAKVLKTNARYWSKVINKTKDKNFANYRNDLRMEYAIEQLKTNPKYQQYSIARIAREVGFNNTKSFSRALLRKPRKQASLLSKELA